MTKDVFSPRQFTDGSKAGSDPYDNPNRKYQQPAPYASPAAKALRANQIAAFLTTGAWDKGITLKRDGQSFIIESTDEALGEALGRAHVRRQEVDDPKKVADYVQRLIDRPKHDHHDTSRPRLSCDVEERIAEWLTSSDVGERLIEAGRAFIEQRERTQLRALLAKYPEEAN